MAASSSSATPDYLFKIIVVGNTFVGKTSCIHRASGGMFTTDYKATVGVDFAMKQIILDSKLIFMQIWDIGANDQQPTALFPSFCRDAVGAFIVCSTDDNKSIDNITFWKEKILETVADDETRDKFIFILLVNKADMYEEDRYPRNFKKIAAEANFDLYALDDSGKETCKQMHFLVSAKTGKNIEEACMKMASECVAAKCKSKFPTKEAIVIDETKQEKNSCCF